MPKLAIIGTIEVTPGKKNQVASLLMAHRARCLKDEAGTLQFDVMLPREDDSKVIVYEVFQDDAAFEAHQSAPSVARWREETAGMVVDIIGTKCTPVE